MRAFLRTFFTQRLLAQMLLYTFLFFVRFLQQIRSFYFRGSSVSNELNSKLTYFLKEVMIYACLKRQRMERRNLLFSMKQCMDSDNLHRRLKKIIGQLQAVDRMIDEEVPCEDILSQMNAAKSAIHKCGQIVLEGHIKHCVKDGLEHGDADKTVESFTKAVERFANMG